MGAPLIQGVQRGIAGKVEGESKGTTLKRMAKASVIPLITSCAIAGAFIVCNSTSGLVNASMGKLAEHAGDGFVKRMLSAKITRDSLTDVLVTNAATGGAVGLISGIGAAFEQREEGESLKTTLKRAAKVAPKSALSTAGLYAALWGGMTALIRLGRPVAQELGLMLRTAPKTDAYDAGKLKNVLKGAKRTKLAKKGQLKLAAEIREAARSGDKALLRRLQRKESYAGQIAEMTLPRDFATAVQQAKDLPGRIVRAPGALLRGIGELPEKVKGGATRVGRLVTGKGRGG